MSVETKTKERSILFSGEMVRAILEGRKTQTRRVIKPQIEPLGEIGWQWNGHTPNDPKKHGACCTNGVDETYEQVKEFFSIFMEKSCPYGVPGDHLYVRETWFPYTGHGCFIKGVKIAEGSCNIGYKADMKDDFPATYRPSIHMPRWASRILLEVTDIRVERVQDISEEDAKAEGCVETRLQEPGPVRPIGGGFSIQMMGGVNSAKGNFHILWNSINEKRGFGWDQNPWVWVVDFKVMEP